jgi:hypothetical protein
MGVLGDALTFLGALLLAWDAARKDKEFQTIDATDEALAFITRHDKQKRTKLVIRIGDEGNAPDPRGVQLVFVQESAKRAKWGCYLLAAGFVALLASRMFEVLRPV